MPEQRTGRVFRFGEFEADETSGELRKHGVRVKLHSQPLQVLLMLLDRPGELVSRDEMRQRLWGSDTFVDFDHGLNSAINKIREALRESASRPRYVETVAGKGYRFIAPVSNSPVAPAKAAETAAVLSPASGVNGSTSSAVLSTPEELPAAPRKLVRVLLLMVQALYLGFYVTALASLAEVDEIFQEARLLSPAVLSAILVTTGAILIPVRLYLVAAAAFDLRQLPAKFNRMFPVLLVLDLLWALSPFLLVHYVPVSLALGMSASLVYLPFAQRSLVLMYGRSR